VGTLKSAKKRGLIHFKGQILLKGMHDNVDVSIVDAVGVGASSIRDAGEGDANGGRAETKSSSAGNDVRSSGGLGGHGQFGGSSTGASMQRRWKPKPYTSTNRNNNTNSYSNSYNSYKNSNTNGYGNSNGSGTSNQISGIGEAREGTEMNTNDNDSNSHANEVGRNNAGENTKESDRCIDGEGDNGDNDNDDVTTQNDGDVHTPLKSYIHTPPKSSLASRRVTPRSGHSHGHSSGRKYNPKPKFKLDHKLFRDAAAAATPESSKNDDTDSVQSFATAPIPEGFRSPSFNPAKTPKPKIDVIHSRMAGTTFQSNSLAETHSERVEREVKQLLEDIRRIEPVEDPFCSFGDLFVDERVEQYYEALIGEFNFGSDGWIF
jgi:hypothetical protein